MTPSELTLGAAQRHERQSVIKIPRIKRLHLFILRTYLGPMLMTFFIVMFILLMQFLWRYLDDLVGKGLALGVILELMLYASAGLMPMAVPLATLLASLMTMGNLGEHNELLAIKASGISLPRMLQPLLWVNVGVTLLAFFTADSIVPVATLKMRALIYSVQQKRPDLVIKPGVFYNDIGKYSLRVAGREPQSSLMRDVMIYDHSAFRGNVMVTRADSGFINFTDNQSHIVIELFHGVVYEELDSESNGGAKARARQGSFARERLVKALDGFGFQRTDEDLFKETFHVMNSRQLASAADSLSQDNAQRFESFLRELHDGWLMYTRAPVSPAKLDTLAPGDSAVVQEGHPESEMEAQAQDTVDLAELARMQPPSQRLASLEQAVESARDLSGRAENFISNYSYWSKHAARHLVELHRKFSLSVACLVFFLIGAPLGAIIRKGGLGMPVVVSVLFFVFYYVVSLVGEKFAKELIWTPVEGMWSSTWILLPVAFFLIYQATTDSGIFRAEWYQQKWRKLLRRR